MSPSLALFLWLILLLGLLLYDPARDSRVSMALWVPLIWMFFIESRLPSQWVGGRVGIAAQALEEGDALDRIVFSCLILVALGILVSRRFDWTGFFTRNLALVALLSFALISAVWSDYPFIAFKRWFRDLGNYLMILIVLSDSHSLEAIGVFLRRLCYLLIPLSVLLVKYYPALGRSYDVWTGVAMYSGAGTSKNMLGFTCLLSGIFFFWDTVTRWPDRKQRRTKRIILVNVAFIAMTLWLLNLANSATSRVCLVLGCLVIAAAHIRWFKRNPVFLKALIPAGLSLYLILVFGFDMTGQLAGAVGRDATLTGRTNIWQAVLSTHTNWLIGTGYESFWLGPRLTQVWAMAGPVNEAHNGYLQMYLNEGAIGLFLLGVLLISSYRTAFRNVLSSQLAPLSAALLAVALFYNLTEAAFNASFMCLTFLLGTVTIARAASVRGAPTHESSLQNAAAGAVA